MNSSDYPVLFQTADKASTEGQKAQRRLIKTDLILLVLAAVLGSAGALVPAESGGTMAAATAVILVLSMLVRSADYARREDKDWFDGRAVAESVKSQSWRYMMRVAPFEADSTCDEVFWEHLTAILNARPNLRHEVGAVTGEDGQITQQMQQVRSRTVAERLAVYLSERLDDQASWYKIKAKSNKSMAATWFWVSLAIQAVALAIAIFRPVAGLQGLNLVGPLAALATAFAAWNQFGRHDELARAYGLAYQELCTIKGLARNVVAQPELDKLVIGGEDAISREHKMWVAKRTDPLPEQVLRKDAGPCDPSGPE